MKTYDQVQKVMDDLVAQAELISAVAEIRDSDGSWFGAAGVADITSGRKRQAGEYLNIGSTGKAFTAATILRLVAEGTVGLDDPVSKWLPGAADANGYSGDQLTVRQMLQNRSGLFPTLLAPEVIGRSLTRSAVENSKDAVWTTAELLQVAISQPPVGAPGERFAYANGGFWFCGAIIEKATGGSYADAVTRNVLQPLNLRHTYVRAAAATDYPAPHPRSYSKKFAQEGVDLASITEENWQQLMEDPQLPPFDATELNSSLGFSGSNIASTTSDLLEFFRALRSGDLLPDSLQNEMWHTISTAGGNWIPNSRYGLGVIELPLANGVRLRGGAGSAMGSETLVFGDDERMIAVHTNSDDRLAQLGQIVAAVFGAPVLDFAAA